MTPSPRWPATLPGRTIRLLAMGPAGPPRAALCPGGKLRAKESVAMKKLLLILVLALSACATVPNTFGTMIPGTLTSLRDGTVLPMQIEVTYGSGKITATDPRNGEVFAGTYTAMMETQVLHHSQQTFLGPQVTGQTVQTSGLATGSAVLVGNKGHVMNVTMKIQPGNPPHGFGEATDNRGQKYNLQF
jgi:hypothetical protein